jgi:hypothetical protein
MLWRFVMLYTIRKQGGLFWCDLPLLLDTAASGVLALPAAVSAMPSGCAAGCWSPTDVLYRPGCCCSMLSDDHSQQSRSYWRRDGLLFYAPSICMPHANTRSCAVPAHPSVNRQVYSKQYLEKWSVLMIAVQATM